MHKTQSLCRPRKWTVPKGSMRQSLSSWHILGMAGEKLRATEQQLGEENHSVHFIRLQEAWMLLRYFSTWVGSYPGSPGKRSGELLDLCLSQTQPLARHSTSSQSNSRRCWPWMLKIQLHLKRSSSIASSWHPSAFSFCSSPSKPQHNSFFRSTQLVKVWKCFDGHVFHLLFVSSEEVKEGSLY